MLAVYLVVAGLLWMAVPAVARVFILPPLFRRAARGGLILGLPVALAVAWRYSPPGLTARRRRGNP